MVFVFSGIITASLTWPIPLLTSSLLILLAFFKHRLSPIPHELLWYLIVFFLGPICEILIIYFGHTWSYPQPDLFQIPIWLLPLWGLTGILFVSLYQGLFYESSNQRQ